MKIDVGNGKTPIWVSPRPGNSLTMIQGTSRLYVSAEEVPKLIEAMKAMTEQ